MHRQHLWLFVLASLAPAFPPHPQLAAGNPPSRRVQPSVQIAVLVQVIT